MIFTPGGSRRAQAQSAGPLGIAAARGQCLARGLSSRCLAGTLAIGSVLAWTTPALAQMSRAVAVAGMTNAQPAGHAAAAVWEGPGGRHEFGAWWGLSLISGHIWGYAGNVKYMPIDVRYSYEFARHKQEWAVRYSPEVTALAMIDWLQPDPATNTVTSQSPRVRAYGGGISPVGFQWGFLPLHRLQPFLSMNAGFLYFDQRVLSTQGSQFMYSIDYGAGFNIFHHGNQAVTVGYRYQHLSNANISIHNPGTDANTFYVGISRFRNKGEGTGPGASP